VDLPFQAFSELVESKRSFAFSCHIHPDGDAIGSMLALGLSLEQSGKDVQLICTEGVPTAYTFLEGSQLILREPDSTRRPEVLFCLDCAEKERAALPPSIWEIPGLIVVDIDHHLTNKGFGNLNIIDPDAAATGEVIYRLIRNCRMPLNRAIATALYTAMATDTGFFRYTNTSAFTLESAALLVKDYGVEPARVAEQVHEQKSYNSLRLLGEVLRSLQIGIDHKVAWMILDQKMLTEYPVENDETESFVNYARCIEGTEIGILFKELRPNEIKLSWRSSTAVDVSKMAAFFGGGGHARAAGCVISGPLDQVVQRVLDFIAEFYRTR
jgi:phosphoesterase RecJ-like protein